MEERVIILRVVRVLLLTSLIACMSLVGLTLYFVIFPGF